jgi:hypothetical protein
MFTNIERAEFTEIIGQPTERESSAAVRFAHYCMLEEAIGAVFGLMTLWYVVCSIARIA